MQSNFPYSNILPERFSSGGREGPERSRIFSPLETGECRSKSPTRKHAWRNGRRLDSLSVARTSCTRRCELRRVVVWGAIHVGSLRSEGFGSSQGLLGGPAGCRERFRVFTFGTCIMNQPAGLVTYCHSKARYSRYIFQKISPYKLPDRPVLPC